ncbi:MAG: dTDP-4-dehydrorhamnose reductase [Emcibacter sp.]|nr:dTDP-4-dehydrorhamnose reductase [Emcibacter sp.]
MKVLITGAGGQLGQDLSDTVPEAIDMRGCARVDLDITDPKAIADIVNEYQPDVIINAAAYTAVDKAEGEQELAFAINRDAVENLALAAKAVGARLIHISTDFIFNGQSSEPYKIDAPTDPLGVYGASKLAGEMILRQTLPNDHTIIRTSWVYSIYGNNFVKTMLRLMQGGKDLSVVSDQIGSPTWAKGLARAIWTIVGREDIRGTFHWSDDGVASWYDFAVAIYEEGRKLGMIGQQSAVNPIPSSEYPTPAKRPNYSLLDKTSSWATMGMKAPHWRENLILMLTELDERKDD